MNALTPRAAEQFDDLDQQKHAASLGMWTFLATEIMFFGAIFLAYTVYRISYPLDFAKAAAQLNITIGTLNTAILLLSSFFIALGVSFIQRDKAKLASLALLLTWALGFVFLLLKAYEYYDDINKHLVPTAGQPVARMFYLIYYTATGVHALHLTIGLLVVAAMIYRLYRQQFSASYYTPIELTGLYWHFVDIVWIFLYPMLYLVGRES